MPCSKLRREPRPTDLKNAYHEIDRGAVLRILYDEPRLKPLWRIANWSYGTPSLLHIFDLNGELIVTILSQVGMRQGCPLAQMLFCLHLTCESLA
jgi:hypothetical protein